MLKDKKLEEIIYLIKRFNEYGYYPFFEGKGNGEIALILEYIEIQPLNKSDNNLLTDKVNNVLYITSYPAG